jgi:formate dehydrogenase maturation protein FdhE
MQISEPDQQILRHFQEAKVKHPGLKELLSFYETLFRIQFEFKAALPAQEELLKQQAAALYRAEGSARIVFDSIKIAFPDFLRLYHQIADLISAFFPDQERPLREIPAETLLETARTFYESGDPVIMPGSVLNLTSVAAGFSLLPYLQLACAAVLPLVDHDTWQRPRCPVCGGKPSFACLARENGARSLLCSRCNAVWQYSRVGCPFCAATGEQLYYMSDDRRYRLYLCDVCRRYIKTIDLRETGSDVCLPVEHLVTVSMDFAAQEKGFRHC